ncbi:hypothetical protein HanRHA438_Chr13g0593961 [Helianthus annuus]|nr:hypothetical protein HanRHA438_Chr13g0593961 [Helianthus annuus]
MYALLIRIFNLCRAFLFANDGNRAFWMFLCSAFSFASDGNRATKTTGMFIQSGLVVGRSGL